MIPVRHASLRCGSPVLADFKFYWWELELECEHVVERRCRYKPGGDRGWGRLHHGRSTTDILPAPKRVKCELCKQDQSSPTTED